MTPTSMPTMDPTLDPTVDPTVDPTLDPTMNPTIFPSKEPSLAPTMYPTSPTREPSFNPTLSPINPEGLYTDCTVTLLSTFQRCRGNDQIYQMDLQSCAETVFKSGVRYLSYKRTETNKCRKSLEDDIVNSCVTNPEDHTR
eukprot:UN25501